MTAFRREFLKWAASGIVSTATAGFLAPAALAKTTKGFGGAGEGGLFDVRHFGAKGDGKTLDTAAVNNAIAAAAAAGGGTVLFPAGNYLCYSIHLASFVVLFLNQGATIVAAPSPTEAMPVGAYDVAEPQGSWDSYQDFGHNHWHDSLIWGVDIHDFAILGPGRIWGKGLTRGHDSHQCAGEANKAIALKNCRNVILRDFSILQGGWFGLLLTGVDNVTIDDLTIDTFRDGMDIDCCRNVRISNCTVNTPRDDAICLKSSFALGYARSTETVTITNCYVTGGYELGSVLDGTYRPTLPDPVRRGNGRIKCGTESNGGFKNITISNCVFDTCKGLALETVDGAVVEDVTITNISMRNLTSGPLFLRLGSRMRGPQNVPVGSLKRVLVSNVTSHGAVADWPSFLSGIPGNPIEDIQINDVYVGQVGGGTAEMAELQPPELEDGYPDPNKFGTLPASGFFIRHVRNLEMSHIDVVSQAPDMRPDFWLHDVESADFSHLKSNGGKTAPRFQLTGIRDFRLSGSQGLADQVIDIADAKKI